MNFRTTARTATALITLALTGLAPVAAQAATDDPWQFDATIYAWLPALSGTTVFPVTTGGSSMGVSTEDVIDALNMAFMGTFSAKKGRWGLWTDLVYADLGGDKSGSRDFTIDGHPVASVSADLSLDMKMWVWTAAATYELAKSPANTTDLVFGARLLDIQAKLGWAFNGSGPAGIAASGSKEVGDSLWDAIVGVKGVAYLGDEKKWFIPYYADIGTGQSDLTWQVNAGIGYRYNWGAVVASWRYLDYNMKSDNALQTLTASGPLIGVNWQW
jgi:hypothetical protein